MRKLILGPLAAAAALAGCAGGYDPNPAPVYGSAAYSQPAVGYVEYGRVTNIAMINGAGPAPDRANAAGATIAGALIGGAVGNQIGHGSGRAAATILGAVGGAALGNSAANAANRGAYPYNTAGPVYRVWIQTDSGAMREYDVQATGGLRPGDRVRIENGVIYLS